MATNNDFSISNISYTNKDFMTIYPELLDKAKSLSYKWNPTVSNESDPGVVLLKLQALIADKNNYNIDKNVLEYFPASVTQEHIARQLFEQLGYSMKWYMAATTKVAIKWSSSFDIKENYKAPIDIPRWTMLCDNDSTIVYTIVGENENLVEGTETAIYPVMQGKVSQYTVNGESTILGDYLDSNNRLYFNNFAIAENGIFIRNVGRESWGDWSKVDNLDVQDYGVKCYKFGVSDDGKSCYIEFPSDADYIIGEGIEIRYIVTDGLNGNIGVKFLEKFFEDKVSFKPSYDDKITMEITSDDVSISNYVVAGNGKDPETIESAYRNYKKTVGTFNTLVSLKDYENKINTSKFASNSFVCDRTNDVQDSYKVVVEKSGAYTRETVVETQDKEVTGTIKGGGGQTTVIVKEPIMDAFALKLYALQYVDSITVSNYASTFSIIPNFKVQDGDAGQDIELLKAYLEENKSIQHNFQVLDENKILFLKNKYPIKCKIIPQYPLTQMQQDDVLNNVYTALCKGLNSQEISFGEEISYDKVYNIIMDSDERIKAIALDDLKYETYAVVYYRGEGQDSPQLKEFLIATEETKSKISTGYDEFSKGLRLEISAKSVLNGNTPLFVKVGSIQYGYFQSAYIVNGETPIPSPITGVGRITTKTEITTNTTGAENIRENESVVLYAPNLIDTMTYSSYCIYLYNGKEVSQNESYQLSNGEWLEIFSRESDESPYSYAKLVTGAIIKPNFSLKSNYDSTLQTSLGSLANTDGSMKQLGDTYTEDINKIQYGRSLGSYKTISVQKINTDDIDTDELCFWYLNSKEKKVIDGKTVDCFVLFKKDTEKTEQSYILKSGEYFLVTDSYKKGFMVYGSGTKITRKNPNGFNYDWYCEVEDISGTTTEGATAIQNWVKPVDKVSATEMQIFVGIKSVVADGATDDDKANLPLTFKSDGVYDKSNNKLGNLSKYTLKVDGTEISPISVGGSSWNGYSVLNFKCSEKLPMVFKENQSIQVTNDKGSYPLNGSDANPLYVLTDYSYNLGGGTDIDVTRTLASGDVEKATIYAYTELKEDATHVNVDTNESYIELKFDGKQSSIGIKARLPKGTYILAIDSPVNSDSGSITISLQSGSNNKLAEIQSSVGSGSIVLTGIGWKYFRYIVNGASEDTITVSQTDALSITCRMKNPIMIDAKNTDSELVSKVKQLDVNSNFDYTYDVRDSDLVEYPLSPKSFNDVNHVYNKFTICQSDFSNVVSNITIANKVR